MLVTSSSQVGLKSRRNRHNAKVIHTVVSQLEQEVVGVTASSHNFLSPTTECRFCIRLSIGGSGFPLSRVPQVHSDRLPHLLSGHLGYFYFWDK